MRGAKARETRQREEERQRSEARGKKASDDARAKAKAVSAVRFPRSFRAGLGELVEVLVRRAHGLELRRSHPCGDRRGTQRTSKGSESRRREVDRPRLEAAVAARGPGRDAEGFEPRASSLHVRLPAAASDLVSEGLAFESLWRQAGEQCSSG